MGYETPQTEVYVQPSSAFGATTEIQTYIGPKGKTGYVRDIDVDISAAMVGTTTVPEICVGTASADATYARFRLGTSATSGYGTSPAVRRATQVSGGAKTLSDFAGHVQLSRDAVPSSRIPADTAFVISRVAGTGGSPAGTARSRVIIDWF